ncbi:MAG: hypothetical protein VX899_16675 [Myxococcota bacterium]|nr:hypothetical protein [Myxococcota bacterium]
MIPLGLPIWGALLAALLGCGGEALGQSSGVPGGGPRARGTAEVLLGELDSRERALDRREASLEAREEELRSVEAELEERLTELEAIRAEVQELLAEADAERAEKVTNLVKMVEAMRSAQAAAVIEALEPALAVEVLDQMNRTKAGKALAAMPPATAASLAERMTRRPLESSP